MGKTGTGKRFIRMDGTGWNAGVLSRTFQSASVRTTAVALVSVAAHTALTGHSGVTEWVGTSIGMAFLCASGWSSRLDETKLYDFKRYLTASYAVDREGRALPPPKDELRRLRTEVYKLRDLSHMNVSRQARNVAGGALLSLVLAVAYQPAILPAMQIPALFFLPDLVREITMRRRCDKILKGTYRLCRAPTVTVTQPAVAAAAPAPQ